MSMTNRILTVLAALAFLAAVPAFADPHEALTLDPAGGKKCYEDNECGKKPGTRRCYSCCNDNCRSVDIADCHNLCDARLVELIGPDFLTAPNEYISILNEKIEAGAALAWGELLALDGLSLLAEHEGERRLALATLVDAWRLGLAEPTDHTDQLVTDALELSILGDDFGVISTAMRMAIEHDIRLDLRRIMPRIIALGQGAGGADLEGGRADLNGEHTDQRRHELIDGQRALAERLLRAQVSLHTDQ